MRRLLPFIAFLVGLAAVLWVGVGYVGTHTLALAITVLIGGFYLMGALELRRFDQATATLTRALADADTPATGLGPWVESLHPSLRNAVRLRIEGERVGLPGPALTPYLAGLLVLLGMLGTFVGMVVTLNGTGLALEGASDLAAIRSSLAAPIKGLGLAFGTSLAGVAASAMLGLMSALLRRDRLQAAQGLDSRIATTLRVFSQAHQRDESFRLLQRQGDAVPALVDRLEQMMAAMERHHRALDERLLAGQDGFHARTEAAYTALAASVDRSLRITLTESAQAAGAAIQPVVEATMGSIARETATLHAGVQRAVTQQLDGLSTRLEASTLAMADLWKGALAEQQRTAAAQSADLRGTLDSFGDTFAQRSAALVDGVSDRLERTVDSVSAGWTGALAQHERVSAQLSGDTRSALTAAAATLAQHSASLLSDVGRTHADLQSQLASRDEERLAAWTTTLATMATSLQQDLQQAGAQMATRQDEISRALAQSAQDLSAQTEAHARLSESFAQRSAALVDGVADRLERTVDSVSAGWTGALAQHERVSAQMSGDTRSALTAAAAALEKHSASLLSDVGRTHADLQTQLAARDEERLAGWTATLAAMAASLQLEWQQAGAQTAARQEDICRTLAQTAQDLSAQTEAHARDTLAEIGQLMQAAAEAPRAAAEVIAELRQKLSDGMARDNAMLDERSRILATLETLLDAVNHAATEQRGAIDALVSTSADLLDRVGSRFVDQVEAQAGLLTDAAAQVGGSAVEVASLGETFGFAVQQFSESNDKLGAQLQRIEGALGKSMTRSDEQLAYYVAQAREVIDLSIMSQKQIVEDLQQLARRQAAVGSDA